MTLEAAHERNFLMHFARKVQQDTGIPLDHLRNLLGVQKYINITKEILRHFPQGHILDWGCGFGQMSYLMKKSGLQVQSFDLVKRQGEGWQELHTHMQNEPVYHNDPVHVPFADEQFDAALSCGVLEHVSDERGSLAEIHRILKKDGLFFIFMLPNSLSITEAIASLRGKSDHPIKYNRRSIRDTLHEAGFAIRAHHYDNFLPKNLTGLPIFLNRIINATFPILHATDITCRHIPLLNMFSGVHTLVTQKLDLAGPA